ncbi:MAG: SHOCT domain-containing protein, partial [Polyangiaceae bacterium]
MIKTLTLTVSSLLLCTPGLAFAQGAPAPLPAASPVGTDPAAPPAATAPASSPPPPTWQSPPSAPPSMYAPEPPPAPGSRPAYASPIELTTLRLLRDKGVISQAEYDSALHDLSESVGSSAVGQQTTVVMGKWATTLYGFVEADAISDSTQSFTDLAGGGLVARAGSLAGENYRFMMGIRNSRLGLRMKAPEVSGVRTSAQFEFDFLGEPSVVGATTTAYSISGIGENAYWANPLLRVRHLNLKVETPVVDFLFGQYWQLFGWQSSYQPNTVELQGVPGELYARSAQFRISKTVKADPITFEIAVAASRPVQRDSGIPDGQGGIRLAVDSWTGVQTVGATGTQISPLSIAATGLVRRVEVNAFQAVPKTTKELTLSAFAVDAFLPVLPGTKDQKGNSLSFNGEFASGYGFNDMYTGLNGGIAIPAYPAPPAGGTQAIPNIDNGTVTFDSGGGIHGIQYTTWLFGGQYYFPGVDGKIFLSGNYSHVESANTHYYGTASKTLAAEDWFDVNLFADPVPSMRIGLEYANFNTMTVDGIHSINHRIQLSG